MHLLTNSTTWHYSYCEYQHIFVFLVLSFYHQTSNISHTKSANLNFSRVVLQLSFTNPLKTGVKSKMKMWLGQRREAMLQLLSVTFYEDLSVVIMFTLNADMYCVFCIYIYVCVCIFFVTWCVAMFLWRSRIIAVSANVFVACTRL